MKMQWNAARRLFSGFLLIASLNLMQNYNIHISIKFLRVFLAYQRLEISRWFDLTNHGFNMKPNQGLENKKLDFQKRLYNELPPHDSYAYIYKLQL